MDREQFLYVYAHANSLAELALRRAVAEADAWMTGDPAGAGSNPETPATPEERADAEQRTLDSAFEGLDMGALDGLPFFGADFPDEAHPAESEGTDASAATRAVRSDPQDSPATGGDRVPARPADRSTHSGDDSPGEPPSETSPSSASESGNSADADVAKQSIQELQTYLDALYGKFDAVRTQADRFFDQADLAALQSVLDRQDPDLPQLDKQWSGEELDRWLTRYLEPNEAIDELVVWVRGLG